MRWGRGARWVRVLRVCAAPRAAFSRHRAPGGLALTQSSLSALSCAAAGPPCPVSSKAARHHVAAGTHRQSAGPVGLSCWGARAHRASPRQPKLALSDAAPLSSPPSLLPSTLAVGADLWSQGAEEAAPRRAAALGGTGHSARRRPRRTADRGGRPAGAPRGQHRRTRRLAAAAAPRAGRPGRRRRRAGADRAGPMVAPRPRPPPAAALRGRR